MEIGKWTEYVNEESCDSAEHWCTAWRRTTCR